ncbi:MAG: hypothetical protein ACOCYZ_03010 [Halococcoides sp.]
MKRPFGLGPSTVVGLIAMSLGIVAIDFGVVIALHSVLASPYGGFPSTQLIHYRPIVHVWILFPTVLTMLLVVLLVGVVDTEGDGFGDRFRAAVAVFEKRGIALPTAVLTAVSVAVATAIGAAAVVYTILTAVRAGWYASGGDPVHKLFMLETGFTVVLAAVFAVALATVRFTDLLALEGSSSRWAWLDSAVLLRDRPLLFVGDVLGTLAVMSLFASVLDRVLRSGFDVLPLVVSGLVAALALVAYAIAHVEVFDRFRFDADRPDVSRRTLSLVAIAAIVIVAATGGAAAVRVTDAFDGQDAIESLPEDPTDAVAVALENTRAANHRVTIAERNLSRDREATVDTHVTIDYDDRRFLGYSFDGDTARGMYLAEGTTARASDIPRDGTTLRPGSADWAVDPFPRGQFADDSGLAAVPEAASISEIRSENETTIVATGRTDRRDRQMRVVVDRQRGVLDRVRIQYTAENGHTYTETRVFDDVGTATVERPSSMGPRQPLSWLWDALLY